MLIMETKEMYFDDEQERDSELNSLKESGYNVAFWNENGKYYLKATINNN